jgi:hypothetical protein
MTPLEAPQRERPTTDDFLDVVFADETWLRAEFDAIVAANWDTAKGGTRRRDGDRRRPRHRFALAPTQARRGDQPAGPAHGRQRSPPARPRTPSWLSLRRF